MASLAVDIGNTFTKIAVFENDELLIVTQFEKVDTALVEGLIYEYGVDGIVVSTVKKKESAEWVGNLGQGIPVHWFPANMTTGIINHYATPETLGADRLAGITGARHLYPETDNLVIGGGTCITYDWVDAPGNYFGGSISPGLNMRYRALNEYTGALPLINADESFDQSYGDSTTGAIRSGVQNGIKYELMGFIESYKKQGDKLNIILSGGDSIFFDTLLKNSIFAPCVKIEPHLVLKGLNAALNNYND